MKTISVTEILLRLFTAAALGSIIGWERERHAWNAGLRTHMMVCLGSALIMIVSAFGFNDILGSKNIVLDPSRIAAQVVSGIGFLGAGTIFFLRNEIVKGLTTAAGLWTVAAIGLATGSGMYIAALITTAIAYIIVVVLKPVEKHFFSKGNFKSIRLLIKLNEIRLDEIENKLNTYHIVFNEVNLSSTLDAGISEIKIRVEKHPPEKQKMLALLESLKKIRGVNEVNFLG